jgi:hypothetical protein
MFLEISLGLGFAPIVGVEPEEYERNFGEPGGTRTRDPLLKRQMLYRLSYRPGATAGRSTHSR